MNKLYDENLKIALQMESYQNNMAESPDVLMEQVLCDEGLSLISEERRADIFDIFYTEFFVCMECGLILDIGDAHETDDGYCQDCGE